MLTRTICHLWGPFYIYSYGAFIALGCVITYFLLLHDKRRAGILTQEQLINFFSASIIVGVLGGRLLHTLGSYDQLNSWLDICALHEGGFSVLGTVLALLLFIPWYTRRHKIPMLPLLDLAALYAPLLHAISRLGCFFAGCCYGAATDRLWAIRYTNPDTIAPLNCWLHPTQLYSAALLFCIFLILFGIARTRRTKPGELLCFYLFFAGIERFVMDFWRDDLEFIPMLGNYFSLHQWIALGLISGAIILYRMLVNQRSSNS